MTGMDSLEFVLVLSGLLISGFILTRYISMRESVLTKKFLKDASYAQQKQKDRERQRESQSPSAAVEGDQLGAWVPELLELVGADESILFENEMPEEIKRLLPLAKGFLDSGGLKKLLDSAGKPPEQGPGGW